MEQPGSGGDRGVFYSSWNSQALVDTVRGVYSSRYSQALAETGRGGLLFMELTPATIKLLRKKHADNSNMKLLVEYVIVSQVH